MLCGKCVCACVCARVCVCVLQDWLQVFDNKQNTTVYIHMGKGLTAELSSSQRNYNLLSAAALVNNEDIISAPICPPGFQLLKQFLFHRTDNSAVLVKIHRPPPCSAGDIGLTPCQGIKIPQGTSRAMGPSVKHLA